MCPGVRGRIGGVSQRSSSAEFEGLLKAFEGLLWTSQLDRV